MQTPPCLSLQRLPFRRLLLKAKFGRRGAFFGGLAAAVVGTAILAHSARSHAAPVYSDCWTEKRPRYNRWGDFRGYRYIRVCN